MILELKEVISKVEQLKEEEQRHIAKLLVEEMEWNNTLQTSQSELSLLAEEALKEHKEGKTKQANW